MATSMPLWGISGLMDHLLRDTFHPATTEISLAAATGQSACHRKTDWSASDTALRAAGVSQTAVAVRRIVNVHDNHMPNFGFPWFAG